MNNGNKPHGRQKTVGAGSANVGKGKQVDTGSRPVGNGGRQNSGSAGRNLLNGLAGLAKNGRVGAGSRPGSFGGQGGSNGTAGGFPGAGRVGQTGQTTRPTGTQTRPANTTSRPASTASRPVSFGGSSTSSDDASQQGGTAPKKFSFKTILFLIAVVIIVIVVMKLFGRSDDTVNEYPAFDDSSTVATEAGDTDSGKTSLLDLMFGSYGDDDSYGSNSYSYGNSNSYGNNGYSYGNNGYSYGNNNNSYGNNGYSYGNNANSYSSDSYSYGNSGSGGTTSSAPVSTTPKETRARFYTPKSGDDVTVMVYMCGTDLESKYGMGTKDLNEMVGANLSDKVNLIVETGGCKRWNNSTVSNSCNQIFKLGYKSISCVEKNFGNAAMTDPDNLAKFIQYCKKNFPAKRNILILWDHGGGSVSGYGYDEKSGSSSSMTLDKINSALKKGGCTFDFIGFDACLMATLETDLVCNNYADYLIASEETEPGTGWYYTNWLTELSRNTAIPTVDLAKTIIDTFVSSCCSSNPREQVTLSVVDLAELDRTVPPALLSFASATSELIDSGNYQQISNARAGARQFAQSSKLNQVDIIDFAQRIGSAEANAFANTLLSCVKYNRSTISRSNGISMYFPYETTKTVNSAISTFNSIGADADYADCMQAYTRCVKSFASLEYGGQVTGSATQVSQSSLGSSGWGGFLDSLFSSGSSGYSSGYGSGSGYSSGSGYGSSSGYGSNSGYGYTSTSPIDVLTGAFSGGSSSSGSAGYGLDLSSILGLLGGFSGRSMPEGMEWVDTQLIADQADGIAAQFVDPSRLTATEKDGHKVLTLTDDEWGLIQTAELNVFTNDGEGFIDLGLDNVIDWLDDESMLLEYDGTWLTLNGNVCAYYLVSDSQQEDGSWVTVGRIPALLNGSLVNLQVVFDDANPAGTVTGAYPLYEDEAIGVQAKGDIEIVAGDSVELLCDYYDLDGNYSASYTLGEAFTVPEDGLTLVNLAINADDLSVTYRLTDLYGNHFWVPVE